MEWIGNIENKSKAIFELHSALDGEGEFGFLMRFRTNPSAMHSEDAVADQLEHVAGQLRGGFTSGLLMDANGNRIGSWTVTIPRLVTKCDACGHEALDGECFEGQDCPKCHDGTMGID